MSHFLLPRLEAQVQIPISLTPPPVTFPISQSFVSLSIEPDLVNDWVGFILNKNDFFLNTLLNLQDLTGVPPRIRFGGNTQDRTNFGSNVVYSETIFPPDTATVPYPEATNITVGQAYYETALYLPQGTHVIWGVNLATNNITAAYLETQAIVAAFSSSAVTNAGVVLDAIEIGNEPDLYPAFHSNSTEYVTEWTEFAQNLSTLAPRFWVGSLAGSSHSDSGFSPQAILNDGILQSTAGSMISTFSQHHYSGSFCSGNNGFLQDLMTKANIRSDLRTFMPDIAVTLQNNLSYVLGETNSDSCHGTPGVSNTAGAALWALDYLLFATQLNISEVFFHNGIGFKYNLIQPTTLSNSTLDGSTLSSPLPPHIQPPYYAAIIAAEAIGNSSDTQVVELNISDTSISGYAFYQGGQLTNAILINSLPYLTTTTGARPIKSVNLTFTSATSPSNMNVTRLSVPHADDIEGLTWGGQTYETSDGKVDGSLQIDTVNVADGLDIQATEVVKLTFF